MDAGVDAGIFAEAVLLTTFRDPERVLDQFENGLRRTGASHLLLTGLPLPRRTVAKLIVRIVWPDLRNGGHIIDVTNGEPLLTMCLSQRRPFVVRSNRVETFSASGGNLVFTPGSSELVASAGGEAAKVVAVPLHDITPYQGCVVVAGRELRTDPGSLAALEYYCDRAFRALFDLGRIDLQRPGDLSERERHVLKLTAIGKTASEIADLLEISQRTVHAHLQNASDKMNASNKTHTVVEALRYGQIAL